MEHEIDERSLKIVELARRGVGGEKEVAQAILRKICKANGWDYEEVLHSATSRVEEFRIKFGKTKLTEAEHYIAAHVLLRFVTTKEHQDLWVLSDPATGKPNGFAYKCTKEQHIQATYAVGVYLREFRKGLRTVKDDFKLAFIVKNRLFRDYETEGDDRELTEEQIEQRRRAEFLAIGMDSIQINKAIEGGKQ